MKITTSLSLCLVSFGLAAAAHAQDVKFSVPGDPASSGSDTPAPGVAAAPAAAPAPGSSFSNTQLCEEVGWAMAKQSGVAELGFGAAEAGAFMKGFNAALDGRPSPYDLKTIIPEMNAFMTRKQNTYLQHMKEQNARVAEKFFATAAKDKDVVQLPSGLYYKILAPGTGDYPKGNETVKVNYTGSLVDGTIFDSSAKTGHPVEFQLDQVIPGWTEGIQKINKGGKIRLFVPANLAYGDDGRPGIPPGSTLIFDVELLDIKPAGAAPATPMPATTP